MDVSRKVLRRMGYLRDQEGIMNRRLREGEAWNRHLEHCKTFIRESFANLPPVSRKSVAVLGSGWLLDIPLGHLRETFKEVILADIHHPPQVRKKVEGMDNVRLLETDLSGGAIGQVWEFTRQKKAEAEALVRDLALVPPLAPPQPSACISLNLLNQLDILLCDFLVQKGHGDPELQMQLRQRIQSFHLEWLGTGPACLITDVCEKNSGRDGKKSSLKLVHVPLPGGLRKESWRWDFDLGGNYRRGLQTHMEVKAVEWA